MTTALVSLVFLLCFSMLQLTGQTYDRQLIGNSTQTLGLYSSSIENELRKMDRLTFDILADSRTQQGLPVINSNIAGYEQSNIINSLMSFLTAESNSASYVASISLIGLNGDDYTAGNSITTLSSQLIGQLAQLAGDKNGALAWQAPVGNDPVFYAVREVRDLNGLNDLGTLIIRISPDSMVRWVNSMLPSGNARLAIYMGQDQIVYHDPHINTADFRSLSHRAVSGHIYTLDKTRYLYSRALSSYSGFTYAYLLPYQDIFRNIQLVRTLMLVGFLLFFFIFTAVGFAFAEGITKPLTLLSKRMKRVESGDFQIAGMRQIPMEYCDEVGQLNNNFIIMIEKINDLIQENYVKQLLVKESELKALQAQINPHFLYNTLDSIHWIAKANRQEQISVMVRSLARLMRSTISGRQDVIRVEEELALLENYLNIQRIRFEQRLDIHISIDPALMSQQIPRLTLQPVFENSIKYGLERKTGVCRICLESRLGDGCYELSITDNGLGMSADQIPDIRSGKIQAHGTGIGLRNIDERIRLYFGDEYGLKVESELNRGTTVTIRLPMVFPATQRGDQNAETADSG